MNIISDVSIETCVLTVMWLLQILGLHAKRFHRPVMFLWWLSNAQHAKTFGVSFLAILNIHFKPSHVDGTHFRSSIEYHSRVSFSKINGCEMVLLVSVCVCTDRKTEIEMKFIIIIVWLHGFIIITHSPNNNCCISVCRMCTKLKAIDLTKSFVPFPMRWGDRATREREDVENILMRCETSPSHFSQWLRDA